MTASGDFSIGSDIWPGISKLIEEAAEVGQVCGKLIGSGGGHVLDPLHDSTQGFTCTVKDCDCAGFSQQWKSPVYRHHEARKIDKPAPDSTDSP